MQPTEQVGEQLLEPTSKSQLLLGPDRLMATSQGHGALGAEKVGSDPKWPRPLAGNLVEARLVALIRSSTPCRSVTWHILPANRVEVEGQSGDKGDDSRPCRKRPLNRRGAAGFRAFGGQHRVDLPRLAFVVDIHQEDEPGREPWGRWRALRSAAFGWCLQALQPLHRVAAVGSPHRARAASAPPYRWAFAKRRQLASS